MRAMPSLAVEAFIRRSSRAPKGRRRPFIDDFSVWPSIVVVVIISKKSFHTTNRLENIFGLENNAIAGDAMHRVVGGVFDFSTK